MMAMHVMLRESTLVISLLRSASLQGKRLVVAALCFQPTTHIGAAAAVQVVRTNFQLPDLQMIIGTSIALKLQM